MAPSYDGTWEEPLMHSCRRRQAGPHGAIRNPNEHTQILSPPTHTAPVEYPAGTASQGAALTTGGV